MPSGVTNSSPTPVQPPAGFTACQTQFMISAMSGNTTCSDSDAYIICMIRAFGVASKPELAAKMQANMQKEKEMFGNSSHGCPVDFAKLLETVKDGTAPTPAAFDAATRQKEIAYASCLTEFEASVKPLGGDICHPARDLFKCIWTVFGVDFSNVMKDQKGKLQNMLDDQLATFNASCDINVDTMVQDLKDLHNDLDAIITGTGTGTGTDTNTSGTSTSTSIGTNTSTSTSTGTSTSTSTQCH